MGGGEGRECLGEDDEGEEKIDEKMKREKRKRITERIVRLIILVRKPKGYKVERKNLTSSFR